MNKKLTYSLFAATLLLAGCEYNEKHFPGYDELAYPTDVRTDTITLSDADYSTIAGLSANQSLALSKDPEGQTYLSALEAVGTNNFFTDDAPAVWYLPAFIDNQYPYLDDGSKVTVNYKAYDDLPDYLSDFNGITDYEFTASDYQTVWGEGSSVTYLTPSTVRQIPSVLKESVSNPVDGAMRLVNYAYSDVEPGEGGGDVSETYTDISVILASGTGEYVARGEVVATYSRGFLLNDGTGSILVYLNAPANYSVGDVVTVSGETSTYSGMYQFTASSEIALAERSETFFYPEATAMSGVEMDAWTENAVVSYVSITGTLSISGNYYNIVVDGASHQGSVSYPAAGLVDTALNGQEVTVTGYLIGYSSSYVNIMATSVVAAGTDPQYTPVGVIALSGAGDYQAKGTVAALYNRGFLLNDGTGSILVYMGSESANQVGDIVTVAGTTSSYAGLMQFSGNISVETVSSTSFTYPAVRTLTGSDMDAYLDMPYVAYVTYEGTLSISGYYYNVTVDGAGTAVGSISYPLDGLVPESLDGQRVIVTGYAIGTSSSRYVNTMAISVEAATAVSSMRLATTRAVSEPNASAVYRYNASSDLWLAYSADEADIAVVQPSDYSQMGYSYISSPETTLPIYLSHTYPYAQTGDVVAVVYYADSDGAIAVTEFAYDGISWEETTVAQDAMTTFQRTDGEWIEALVYYESTLLGDETGGFTIQDIELSTLTYVWQHRSSYGWTASAYSGGNIAAESWLISPEIDLTEGVAPVMTFDAAINYLNGKNLSDYFDVNISTDYNGDVTEATWETLTITGWPAGNNWTFVSIDPVDLTQYAGSVIRLGFHYHSTTEAAPTIEIQNLSVQE